MQKLIMFDLDGTVLDTEEDLLICANYLFDKFGYEKVDAKRVREANGKDAVKYVETLVGKEIPEQEFKMLWDNYMKIVAEMGFEKTKVYAGLEEVLFELKRKGHILAILTNKASSEMATFIEKFLSKLPFDEIQAVGGTEKAKPSPKAIYELLEKYNIEKENAYMVGDGEPDIITGINAKINSIAVLWGNRKKEELALVGAKIFASKPKELLNLLK